MFLFSSHFVLLTVSPFAPSHVWKTFSQTGWADNLIIPNPITGNEKKVAWESKPPRPSSALLDLSGSSKAYDSNAAPFGFDDSLE